MSVAEAREMITTLAWEFISPLKYEKEEYPPVLYKFICFDWIVQRVLGPIKEALEIINSSDGDKMLPQKVIILKSLAVLRPPLVEADGKVNHNEQVWRDESILLFDEITRDIMAEAEFAQYFPDFV